MAKPHRRCMARALAGTIAILAVSLSLQLVADADREAALPAPPLELELESIVKVPPELRDTETLAPSEAAAVVEVPPAVEGRGVLAPLLEDEPSGQQEPRAEPAAEVPSMVSVPAEPIVPPPTTRLTVTLDWYLNPQHAALLVARERGMFARRGLDVALIAPADPSVPAKLLAAGRTDLALGRQPQLHLLVDKGMPVVRVATLIAAPVSGLLVSDALGSDSGEIPLEGLRIGVTDGDGRDVVLASMLTELLGTAMGLELVELEEVGYSALAAMREQRVDGLVMHHRFLLPRQLADEGVMTRTLPSEAYGLPAHDGLILMANRDRLNGKRDAVRRLVSALEEAALWIVNHPHEAWQLLETAEPALADHTGRDAWNDIVPRLALQPAAVDRGRYLRFEQFLLEAGVVETATPLERLAVDLGTTAP
ncbi:ABC transporter substrate-binding protein [Halomonas sp. MCCC 1A17488]|uniref:ABC transporter substrate-binding protein n=1 Tax=unclassified Halomonas TaxID=2609666 RepID=UPI0018D271C1|nr:MULTISPECIES: ABC transporter substrate-binding protein [unclassified Halomonas]MCE8015168.1 ABC transporter substrate-binding protein [Halomonas sp. MCCC 1A17488]MCG3238501.1 ABC transporter substrate-binding protein [Halomonas sp. MCCC 1A17488]QPP47758.1 ABC transporter substrate-binding protein [Halomonas sp. SS10-MC5]